MILKFLLKNVPVRVRLKFKWSEHIITNSFTKQFRKAGSFDEKSLRTSPNWNFVNNLDASRSVRKCNLILPLPHCWCPILLTLQPTIITLTTHTMVSKSYVHQHFFKIEQSKIWNNCRRFPRSLVSIQPKLKTKMQNFEWKKTFFKFTVPPNVASENASKVVQRVPLLIIGFFIVTYEFERD